MVSPAWVSQSSPAFERRSDATCVFKPHRHVLSRHLFQHEAPDAFVEAAQKQIASVDQGRLGAEPGEDAGELDRDVATADDQRPLREARQVERFVGGDRLLRARKVGHDRPAAGGYQNVAGGDDSIANADGVFADEGCPLFEDVHVRAFEQPPVDAVQALDLAGLVVAQRVPVETDLADAPAVAARRAELLAEASAVDEELFRHAADVHASAAEIALLRDADLGAQGRGDPRRADPAGARADDEQVVVVSLQQPLAILVTRASVTDSPRSPQLAGRAEQNRPPGERSANATRSPRIRSSSRRG